MTVKEYLERQGGDVKERESVCGRMCAYLSERRCPRRHAAAGSGGVWDYEELDLDHAYDYACGERQLMAERVLDEVLGRRGFRI